MDTHSTRVTLFDDGVYRWSYGMDMWHNRCLIGLASKIIRLILVILTLIIYTVTATVFHGTCHLCFRKDKSAVALVRNPRTMNKVNAFGTVVAMVGWPLARPTTQSASGARWRRQTIQAPANSIPPAG